MDDHDHNDDVDRISELPEPILHIILSRLPNLKDVVRASVLSNRWGSLWVSIPNLDFQEKYFAPEQDVMHPERLPNTERAAAEILRKRQKFVTYVDDTVSRRRMSNVGTKKFKLHISFPSDMSLASHIDQWVGYAVDAKVEDLCLLIQPYSIEFKYKLPEVLFATKTLTILHLRSCIIEPNGDIRLPMLQKLYLYYAYIKDHTFQHLFSGSPRIEYVDLFSCRGLENNYSFSSLKLKHVELGLIGASEIGKVDVKAPYLQCFRMNGDDVPCEINITSCYYLKEVSLFGTKLLGVTERYIQDLISKLPCLENLFLAHCLIESIYISSPQLKKFSLCICPNLVEVKIDAPNLLHFVFDGSIKTTILLISTSSHLEVELYLLTNDAEELSNNWFVDLIEFFKIFDRCKVVTLGVFSAGLKFVYIPNELREGLLPPLHNVKHLKLIIIIYGEPTHETVSLVDGLLWICPRVETLSIESQSDTLSIESQSDHKHLEFVYGEQLDSDEGSCNCRFHPYRCWRHFLREVKIVNFHENEVEEKLQEYFVQNAKSLEMIHVLD